jgi:catalase
MALLWLILAASHPNMPRALATVQPPDSFGDEEYYGVNAFILVNDKGERRAARYVMAPEKLVHLTAEEAAKTAPDFPVKAIFCKPKVHRRSLSLAGAFRR